MIRQFKSHLIWAAFSLAGWSPACAGEFPINNLSLRKEILPAGDAPAGLNRASTAAGSLQTVPYRSLKVGNKAPDFTLTNAQGQPKSLYELLRAGPVVLAFYRGASCPYCEHELRDLQNDLSMIENKGATLVAVSPQAPEKSEATVNKDGLKFEVLSDPGDSVSRRYGLVITVPKSERPFYGLAGAELPEFNGDKSYEVPVSATYIVDRDGVIKYAFVDRNYRERASEKKILKKLDELSR